MLAREGRLARCLLITAAFSLAVIAGAGSTPGGGDGHRTYTGTSGKGDLAEALGGAVAAAAKEMPCCDRILEWRLKEVSGEQGGIAGSNRLTVTIEAHVR